MEHKITQIYHMLKDWPVRKPNNNQAENNQSNQNYGKQIINNK